MYIEDKIPLIILEVYILIIISQLRLIPIVLNIFSRSDYVLLDKNVSTLKFF